MLSALLSFFGGSVFRMIWGEVSAWLKARQEHAHELERLRLQAEMDAAAHSRNLEAIRVQHELGVQVIRVQGEADTARIETDAWVQGVRATMTPSGVAWVDAWNASIRPALATIVIVCWMLALHRQGWTWSDWDRDLAGAVLGLFVADRILSRRGR